MKALLDVLQRIGSGRIVVLAVILMTPHCVEAQLRFFKGRAKSGQIQKSLDDYLAHVRAQAAEQPHTMGSLWTPSSLMSMTESDYKARLPGDLLVIKVSDTFSSTNTGTAQQQRTFSASSGLSSNLIGNAGTAGKLQSLFSPTSAQNLGGKGQSALTSTLNLNLAARVVETLPNGVMVVEAVRDFTVGNDRQTIVLRGLVRPGDIAADNSVPSSAVGNLEAEVHGKGVVADSIRQPNILVRAVLRLLNF